MNKKICILIIFIIFIINCKGLKPVPVDMVLVKSGSFIMGDDNAVDSNQKPAHKVNITKSFYISKYEVTFEQYDVFCNDTKRELARDNGWGRCDMPVIFVSYYDAIEFCNWLSRKERLIPCYSPKKDDTKKKKKSKVRNWQCDFTVNGYRLPTEAEWEYAASGGNNTNNYIYSGSNNLDEVAWYGGNSDRKPHPVGKKKPNDLGVYDMTGNLCEWCWDWFDGRYYGQSPVDDPKGPDKGSWFRSIRGGGFDNSKIGMTVKFRDTEDGICKEKDFGFRIVRNAE